MKHSNQKELTLLRRTMMVVVSFMFMAAMIKVVWAEETEPLNISSQEVEAISKAEASKKESKSSPFALGVGVTPLFGLLQPIDGNKLLKNKYSAGFAAEFRVLRHLSIEGVARYALYEVRPGIVFRDRNIARVSSAYGNSGSLINRYGYGRIGDMRQIMLGGNVKYEMFPDSIITPYIGAGVVHFKNDYFTSSKEQNTVKVMLPQSVYAVNAIGGLKLKLSDSFSLLCRGEAGSLLNNRNGSILYYEKAGSGASVYEYRNFRSYDKYVSGLVGVSLGL